MNIHCSPGVTVGYEESKVMESGLVISQRILLRNDVGRDEFGRQI